MWLWGVGEHRWQVEERCSSLRYLVAQDQVIPDKNLRPFVGMYVHHLGRTAALAKCLCVLVDLSSKAIFWSMFSFSFLVPRKGQHKLTAVRRHPPCWQWHWIARRSRSTCVCGYTPAAANRKEKWPGGSTVWLVVPICRCVAAFTALCRIWTEL